MLLSLADLITMATFLSITPSIKDVFNCASARGEKKGTMFSLPHSAVPLSTQDKCKPCQKYLQIQYVILMNENLIHSQMK